MTPKAFLIEECGNVKDLLDNTLRHDYGIDSSRHFYDECAARLEFITNVISITDEADKQVLAALGGFLNELAALICRIERSSIGEYSWAFVEEVKQIASVVCCESTLTNPETPPNIYVFAEGGLTSYAIYTERIRPYPCQRRLLTIVFPKSLKHFVLLHPILGHELGHAIWQVSKHQQRLRDRVLSALQKPGSPLQNPTCLAARLYSDTAPQEVKDYLASINGLDEGTIFQKVKFNAWIEEILCDLVGLAIFGPGFLAAHCRLLYTVAPSGITIGVDHPPVAWRFNMVWEASKILGYDVVPIPQDPHHQEIEKFWNVMEEFRKEEPWFNLLPMPILEEAILEIKSLLEEKAPAFYPIPDINKIGFLLNQLGQLIPPVGYCISDTHQPELTKVDFRDIIYAGWIAAVNDQRVTFKRINQLCEHAIMQQRAIEMVLDEETNS